MKIIKFVLIGIVVVLAGGGIIFAYKHFLNNQVAQNRQEQVKDIYYCPMHQDFKSDKPGTCPICGMNLVKKVSQENVVADIKKENKLLYYRNPMNPEITSPVPMKDHMGMDYVPVYEESSQTSGGIYISPERQQLVGVRKEMVQKRQLVSQISTVGKIAYDPDLYVAQEEYFQARGSLEDSKASDDPEVKEQAQIFVNAATKKLSLLGMSVQEIEALVKAGKPQEYLYLPQSEGKAWAYLTIYEYESSLVKIDMPVEITANAFPGKVFNGKIVSLVPVVDAMSRTISARAIIDDPKNEFKPQMFVNAKINIDLGEKLSVSEEAVMNTGARTIVVVADDNGNFFSKDVLLGQKAQGYYEILDGLSEGDGVVTSGNFLIDSESRLQSAFSGNKETK